MGESVGVARGACGVSGDGVLGRKGTEMTISLHAANGETFYGGEPVAFIMTITREPAATTQYYGASLRYAFNTLNLDLVRDRSASEARVRVKRLRVITISDVG